MLRMTEDDEIELIELYNSQTDKDRFIDVLMTHQARFIKDDELFENACFMADGINVLLAIRGDHFRLAVPR